MAKNPMSFAKAGNEVARLFLFFLCSITTSLLAIPDRIPVHFLLTGDLRANIEPCGCANNPSGGLAKIKGYLDSLEREETNAIILALDTGDLMESIAKWDVLQSEKIYSRLTSFGFLASVFGIKEAELLKSQNLRNLFQSGMPFLLAHPGPKVKELTRPYLVHTIRKNKKSLDLVFYGFTYPDKQYKKFLGSNFKTKKVITKNPGVHIALGGLSRLEIDTLFRKNSFLDFYFGHIEHFQTHQVIRGKSAYLGGDEKGVLHISAIWDQEANSLSISSWEYKRLGNGVKEDLKIEKEVIAFKEKLGRLLSR